MQKFSSAFNSYLNAPDGAPSSSSEEQTSDSADNVTVIPSSLLLGNATGHRPKYFLLRYTLFNLFTNICYLQIFFFFFCVSLKNAPNECQDNRMDNVAHLSISEKITGLTATFSQSPSLCAVSSASSGKEYCFPWRMLAKTCFQVPAVPGIQQCV